MNESNPFESTSAPSHDGRGKSVSIVAWAITGCGIGLAIGLFGIVGLFYFIPGTPGVAELLILLIGITIFFALPGLAVGVLIGFVLNSKSKSCAQ